MTVARFGVVAALLAWLAFGWFVLPGHTYLLSDTQIYAPVIERLAQPSLFRNDLIPRGTHVTLTIYDEAARVLLPLTGDLQRALQIQQLAFRFLGLLGVYGIARAFGLRRRSALLTAGLCQLGVAVAGPAVLTVEYEPVPRGFAIALLTSALGAVALGRWWIAGGAAGLAFLYHAPAVWPFWLLAAAYHRRRELWVPFGAAVLILTLCAAWQEPAVERQSIFTQLSPPLVALQKLRASYNWISIWFTRWIWLYALAGAVTWIALRRLSAPQNLRPYLIGLPVIGLATMPASYLLLEQAHWALLPQLQPMRALLFTLWIPLLLAAILIFRGQYRLERVAALAFVLWMPFATMAKIDWSRLLAGTLNYTPAETPELERLAAWARANTHPDAVFLFTEAGRGPVPGIFRARAKRAVFVDWKSGGQVNYFPGYAQEWWRRWQAVRQLNPPTPPDEQLAALGIEYVVERTGTDYRVRRLR